MFAALGLLLAGYGAAHAGEASMRPTGVPITLLWGLVLLAFGALMLFAGRRAARR